MVVKVDLQYHMGGVYWTNKFYIEGTVNSATPGLALEMANVLKTTLSALVTIEKARLTPAPFTRNTYSDVTLNVVGTRMVTPPGPLFTVVRWDFGHAIGRSIHHYIRGGILPTDFGSDGNFTSDAQGFNQGVLALMFDQTFVLCDKDGNQYTTANASPKVGMRQMRRGSRKRSTPII